MGISSAFGALKNKVQSAYNKVQNVVNNSIIGKYGNTAQMTLDTSGRGFDPPIKINDSGIVDVYDPVINSAVKGLTGIGTMPEFASRRPSGSSSPAYYGGTGYSGGSGNSGAPSASGLDYLYADLSKHYGMDAGTAFQEALANTEYSRSVEDMKRAGLNPAAIFGSGSGGADGANSHIKGRLLNSGGSGGSGGSRRAYYSSRGNKGYTFSPSAYSIISTLGGIVGGLATKSPSGYWMGSSVSQGVMHAISSASKLFSGKK